MTWFASKIYCMELRGVLFRVSLFTGLDYWIRLLD